MCSLLSRWLTTLDQAHDCRMQSLWRRWPLGQVGLTTTGYRRSLNRGGAGGQVFTSSPPQGSLSDPAPTPSTCCHLLTLNSQHSGCQRCSHLTAACKYGSDAPR